MVTASLLNPDLQALPKVAQAEGGAGWSAGSGGEEQAAPAEPEAPVEEEFDLSDIMNEEVGMMCVMSSV